MRRRLFNIAAVVSLIVCGASIVLWIHELRVDEEFVRFQWTVTAKGYAWTCKHYVFSNGAMFFSETDGAYDVPDSRNVMRYGGSVLTHVRRPAGTSDAGNVVFTLSFLLAAYWSGILPVLWLLRRFTRLQKPHIFLIFACCYIILCLFSPYPVEALGNAVGIFIILVIPAAPIFLIVHVVVAGIRNRHRRRFAAPDTARPCSACGYSLKGNVSGVCPECGTPILTRHSG